MKVKFFSNYSNSAALLKRFKDNYIITDDILQFTTDDDYDVAVVFNKTFDTISSSAKIVTFIQEPSWSPIHIGNQFLLKSDILVIHDKELFEKTLKIKLGGKVIESPSFMWFHDHIEKEFFENLHKVKKKKNISMIVSSIYMSVGNYVKRLELVDKILKSDLEIDIYGRGLNIDDIRYKGELENKFTGLIPYHYSIAIENSCEKNYVTEKFIDPILCNTIPIYYGAPNIDDIYPKDSYNQIDLNSNSIIEDIKNIIKTPKDIVIRGDLFFAKELYFDKYSLYTKLKEILC